MSVLGSGEIEAILLDYLGPTLPEWEVQKRARPKLFDQLVTYLELLLKWNTRTNLSAIRDPEEIVRRHFGEGLFAACTIEPGGTLLDLGSGAGFPGLPVQLWSPGFKVTLAESQGKKAAFLREVVRALQLETEVWGGRAEELAPARTFHAVIMRAVDVPERAMKTAIQLSRGSVWLLGTQSSLRGLPAGAVVVRTIDVPCGSSLFEIRRGMFHVEQHV